MRLCRSPRVYLFSSSPGGLAVGIDVDVDDHVEVDVDFDVDVVHYVVSKWR